MDQRAYEPNHLEENGIREIAWQGPKTITGRGDIIRPLAGRTHTGDYKAGMGTLSPISNENEPHVYGLEIFDWSKERYADKAHAVSVAREWIADAQNVYQGGKPLDLARKTPAAKYGAAGESIDRQPAPPSRSRR
jgi:hypothetical protein